MAIRVFALNDFARPLKMINPESAKMDMPAIKPVIPKAATALLSPVFDKTYFAIVTAAPVISSIMAITAPSIIRKPVDAIVFPKPSFMILSTSLTGKTAIARKSDTRKRETNALSFHLEVSRIMATILITTSVDNATVLILRSKIWK